jgi:hypothetical protein
MERIMGTKSWRYNRKNYSVRKWYKNDSCLKQNCHNIQEYWNVQVQQSLFMVVTVAAIGAAWEAKSLKSFNNLT